MVRSVSAVSAALLLIGAALTGCGPREQKDLTATLLFTATGAFDAQANTRDRVGGGIRRVQWTTRPPLNAQTVTVRFDSDARTLAWIMEVQQPTFTVQEVAGEEGVAVNTVQGEGFVIRSGRLRDVLVLSTAQGLTLMTRGYATQEEPGLLPAFQGARPAP